MAQKHILHSKINNNLWTDLYMKAAGQILQVFRILHAPEALALFTSAAALTVCHNT